MLFSEKYVLTDIYCKSLPQWGWQKRKPMVQWYVGHVVMQLPVRLPPRLDYIVSDLSIIIFGTLIFEVDDLSHSVLACPLDRDLPITGNMFYPSAIVSNKLIIETIG